LVAPHEEEPEERAPCGDQRDRDVHARAPEREGREQTDCRPEQEPEAQEQGCEVAGEPAWALHASILRAPARRCEARRSTAYGNRSPARNAVDDERETSYAGVRENADADGVRTADDSGVTAAEQEERSRVAQLSPREHEILALLSEGLTGRAIARRLFLSPETVRTHVRNATTKLGARTRVQAVAMLVRERAVAPAA